MSEPSPFGLVREAPAFVCWQRACGHWRACGGAASRTQAERLKPLIGATLVLPRGEQPGQVQAPARREQRA